jgi:hypothetical protein
MLTYNRHIERPLPKLHPSPVRDATTLLISASAFKKCGFANQTLVLKESMDVDSKSVSCPSPRKIHRLTSKRAKTTARNSSPSAADTKGEKEHVQPEINQTPCHACKRHPRMLTQLSLWMDCTRCGERTCYICIRNCEAQLELGCSARQICRRCCEEQGEDGFVVCVDCVEVANFLDTMHD